MDVITFAAFVACVFLTIRLAEQRGRSLRTWGWIAALVGPLALPLIFLFPNRHRSDGDLT